MTHSVYLVIGRGEPVAQFLRDWPLARAVDLEGGWQAIPMDDALHGPINEAAPMASRPPELDVAPPGLVQALMKATAGGGGLAYVETDYWGGSGGQSAMACVDGDLVVHPRRSKGAGGPINSALRAIGVVRTEQEDEFDTIALGYRRTMSDFEPEGPVRLRKAPPEPVAAVETAPAAPSKHLPVWLVLLLIATFVTIGALVATAR